MRASHALFEAARRGDVGTMRELLDRDYPDGRLGLADLRRNGNCVLGVAAAAGRAAMVEELFARGMTEEDARSAWPQETAARNGHEGVIERLVAHGLRGQYVRDETLLAAARKGRAGVLRQLLKVRSLGAEVAGEMLAAVAEAGDGETLGVMLPSVAMPQAMEAVARGGTAEQVRQLLAAGAPMLPKGWSEERRTTAAAGASMLTMVVNYGTAEMLEALVEAGLTAEQAAGERNWAMRRLAGRGCGEAVELLQKMMSPSRRRGEEA